jgi:hypothetical protein
MICSLPPLAVGNTLTLSPSRANTCVARHAGRGTQRRRTQSRNQNPNAVGTQGEEGTHPLEDEIPEAIRRWLVRGHTVSMLHWPAPPR